MEKAEPDVDPWVCVILLAITTVFISFTTEFVSLHFSSTQCYPPHGRPQLVQSVRPMEQRLKIREEYVLPFPWLFQSLKKFRWFGLFLLPMVSYSADGILSTGYFIRRTLVVQRYLGAPAPICRLAQGRSIDLGIQFLIFWMPFLVLIGWFTHKPMALLFDLFEVSILLGACFLVNYVTADAKTNWCEGMIMVTFYLMIVWSRFHIDCMLSYRRLQCITAWFYPGQPEIRDMITCTSVHLSSSKHNLTAHNSTLATYGSQENTTQLGGTPQRAIVGPQTHTINKRLEKLLEVYGVENANA
jgi:Ca2+:H+ antiporter